MMIDFRNPAVVALNSCAYHPLPSPSVSSNHANWAHLLIVALGKLNHTVDGLYM